MAISTIDISNASVIGVVRSIMAEVNASVKGLMPSVKLRYVTKTGLTVVSTGKYIRLYRLSGQSAVSFLLSHGRIEGDMPSTLLISATLTTGKNTRSIKAKLIDQNLTPPQIYQHFVSGEYLDLYIKVSSNYTITTIAPLIERSASTCILEEVNSLPDTATQIPIS